MELQVEELLGSTLDSYRATLAEISKSGAMACPPLGPFLQQSLTALQSRLSAHLTSEEMKEIERLVREDLRHWGEDASEYLNQKTSEVKEIMMIVVNTAQAIGQRDQRHTNRFHKLAEQLNSIANLEQLAEIRHSLTRSGVELKSCVDKMAEDNKQAVAQIHTELAEYQKRLNEAQRLAFTDPLTGLDNRRKLERNLDLRINLGHTFCVAVIDLDGFKKINDVFGHLAGDLLLMDVAQELRSLLRTNDMVARWGGDEFVTVMDCDLRQAQPVLERIRQRASREYRLKVEAQVIKIPMKVSIGVAEWRFGEAGIQVLGRADANMYEQKKLLRAG
jgi:diguanylate cyclase